MAAADQGTVTSPEAEDDDYCDEVTETAVDCKISTLGPCHIVELPSELFLHICSYLDARFVIQTLSRVCKSFYNIVSSDKFWKVRIRKRWPKKYPAIPVNDECFNWKKACIQREELHKMWSNPDQMMNYYCYGKQKYTTFDAIHLMRAGTILAAGSRDYYAHVIDLTKLVAGEADSIDEQAVVKMNTHKSWVWTIKSLDNILSTGSWDNYIRFWDMSANCQLIQKIKLDSAVLSSLYEPDLFVAGTYSSRVYLIDPRSGDIITEKKHHKRPVLCLAMSDNYLLSGSEDGSLCIYDRRASDVLKSLTFEHYPLSLSYLDDQLWVGCASGMLHLVDATDGDFNVVDTYDIGHKSVVTSVISTLGAIFTSSKDKTVKVLEPSVNPSVIKTLDEHNTEVSRIDFQNGVLAVAASSIGIYLPKRR